MLGVYFYWKICITCRSRALEAGLESEFPNIKPGRKIRSGSALPSFLINDRRHKQRRLITPCLPPLFFENSPKGEKTIARVERSQKNLMRSQMEEIILLFKSMQDRIELFNEQTIHEDYKKIWRELIAMNDQQIQKLTRLMIAKCNR